MSSIAHAVRDLDGSLYSALLGATTLAEVFPMPTRRALAFLLGLLALQLALMLVVPGAAFDGPRAPSGHVPRYRDNGLLCFFLTIGVLTACCAAGMLEPTLIYDELGPILTALNGGALLASAALCAKGLSRPSTRDCGSSGSIVMDLYWGTELYPRVCGVDLKRLLIARYGIVLWCLFALSFGAESARRAPDGWAPRGQLVSVSLQAIYLAKFFAWERWYTHAADIAVDRFGFMMCWGPVCFMPIVHTLQNLYLVASPGLPLSRAAAAAYVAAGVGLTALNYDADTQRHRVRASDGKCRVWGRKAVVIRASYTTADGGRHRALLSCCGYQAISRHFHYLPDILSLLLYCSPAGFARFLPWLYCVYLTCLLLDRTYRVDGRCEAKYGAAWREYCRRVPWRLVPGIW